MARQIDYQRYLLERETRRYERYKKREQRNLQLKNTAPPSNAIIIENEESQIVEAIEASKRQYKLEQRQRRTLNGLASPSAALNEEERRKAREKRRQQRKELNDALRTIPLETGIYPRILKQSDFISNTP